MAPSSETVQFVNSCLEAARPHHWVKNLLVFLPMLAAHQVSSNTLLNSVNAFVSFSLIASAVYLLNDLYDCNADKTHSRKRNRPLASGRITRSACLVCAGVFLVAAFVSAARLGTYFSVVLLAYLSLAVAYTVFLKRIVYLDVCILAGLYTSRIIAGGAATAITPSVWLLLFSACIFFALAAVKRLAELRDIADSADVQSISGRGYHLRHLPIVERFATIAGYASVVILALYFNSSAVERLYQTPVFLWLICLVLIVWLRHIFQTTASGRMHDDPVIFATTDRRSLICFVLIVGFVAFAITF